MPFWRYSTVIFNHCSACFDGLIWYLILLYQVHGKRLGWLAREQDPLYRKQPPAQQPIAPVPFPPLERSFDVSTLLGTSGRDDNESLTVNENGKRKLNQTQTANSNPKKLKSKRNATPDVVDAQEISSQVIDEPVDLLDERETKALLKTVEAIKNWAEIFASKADEAPQKTTGQFRSGPANTKIDHLDATKSPSEPPTNINAIDKKRHRKFIVINQDLL